MGEQREREVKREMERHRDTQKKRQRERQCPMCTHSEMERDGKK